MGIDIDIHHPRSGHRKAPKSDDPYRNILHKLYSFVRAHIPNRERSDIGENSRD